MTEWWSNLVGIEKIYWIMAIMATMVLMVQTLLMFMGADVDSDVDTDFGDFEHSTGLHPLSIRGVLGAFTGFGWGGIASLSVGASPAVSLIVGGGCGLIFMMTVAYLMAFFHGLTHLAKNGPFILLSFAVFLLVVGAFASFPFGNYINIYYVYGYDDPY